MNMQIFGEALEKLFVRNHFYCGYTEKKNYARIKAN